MTDASAETQGEVEAAPRRHGGRRGGWLPVGAVVLVLVLVLVLSWYGIRRIHRGPSQIREPFAAAVIDLARQSAVRYRSSSGSPVVFDIGVSASGSMLGTATVAGSAVRVLVVDGHSYLKPPDDLLPSMTGAADSTGLAGRWITGGDSSPLAPGLEDWQRPAQFAQTLLDALNSSDTVFPTADAAATTVDGISALMAETPAGRLYVKRSRPHRVLRLEASDSRSERPPPTPPPLPSIPPLSAPTPPSVPTIPPPPLAPSGHDLTVGAARPSLLESVHGAGPGASRRAVDRALVAPGGVGTIDLPAMNRSDANRLLGDLHKNIGELKDAVDTSIQFQLSGSADLQCSTGGCSVTAHVGNVINSGDPNATVAGGEVSAVLTASVQIEGTPAGSCTTTSPLPLNGTSDISCTNSGAGSVFAQIDDRKRREAEAQSRASGGVPVPYTVQSYVTATVYAAARIDLRVLVAKQLLEEILTEGLGAPEGRTDPDPQTEPGAPAEPGPIPEPEPPADPEPGTEPSPTRPPLPGGEFPRDPDCLEPMPPGAYEPKVRAGASAEGWILNSTGPGGRAETGTACVRSVNGHRSRPSSEPVGMSRARVIGSPYGKDGLIARCHIVGAQLGGSNSSIEGNMTPCWQNPTNVPDMSTFEGRARRASQGQVLRYQVTPRYKNDKSTVPRGFTMFYIAGPPNSVIPHALGFRVIPTSKNIGGTVVELAD